MTRFLSLSLALYFFVAAPIARAGGELTYLPTYSLSSKKFDPTRFGLYIDEPLTTDWTYSSWTGMGRVYLDNPGVTTVKWYTTEQDFTHSVTERIKIGAGGGYSFSEPSNHSDFDVHGVIRVKLW